MWILQLWYNQTLLLLLYCTFPFVQSSRPNMDVTSFLEYCWSIVWQQRDHISFKKQSSAYWSDSITHCHHFLCPYRSLRQMTSRRLLVEHHLNFFSCWLWRIGAFISKTKKLAFTKYIIYSQNTKSLWWLQLKQQTKVCQTEICVFTVLQPKWSSCH